MIPICDLTYDHLIDLCNRGFGISDVPCPFCGPGRRDPANRKRRVLRIWSKPGFATYNCARCQAKGWARDNGWGQNNTWQVPCARDEVDPDKVRAQCQLEEARWLWRHRGPIEGTEAEPYLRDVRKCNCEFPATLGYLPPLKQGHHPALISAFGVPHEPQPGVLELSDLNVRGIHLTLLKSDGSGKADVQPNKLFVGPSKGWPIVIAPPTHQLGLAITEGIEDALSVHQAIDVGVWAAGAANRMPPLTALVPADIGRVTIFAHNDEDDQGQRSALALADALFKRGIEVFVEGLE
jgi:Toprim domain-containing protein